MPSPLSTKLRFLHVRKSLKVRAAAVTTTTTRAVAAASLRAEGESKRESGMFAGYVAREAAKRLERRRTLRGFCGIAEYAA